MDYIRAGGNPNEELWGIPLIAVLFRALSCRCYDDELTLFFQLVDLLLKRGADPNVTVDDVTITYAVCSEKNESFFKRGEVFSKATCFQILYFYLKLKKWDPEKEWILEQLFDRLLQDPKVDLRATFTEEHTQKAPDWDFGRDGGYDFEISQRNLYEDANLLHYATLIGDTVTIDKLLSRDPDLIHSQCYAVSGRNFLHYGQANIVMDGDQIISLNKNSYIDLDRLKKGRKNSLADFLADGPRVISLMGSCSYIALNRLKQGREIGVIAYGHNTSPFLKEELICNIERVGKVTALHIAAREANTLICGFLLGRNAYRGAIDSSKMNPLSYLSSAYKGWKMSGGIASAFGKTYEFKPIQDVKALSELLRYQPQIPKTLPQAHCLLHKEGYSILYDTQKKVAIFVYEYLSKNTFVKKATRKGIDFTQENKVPELNRATNQDYQATGYDRGHLRAAENATHAITAMKDTFTLANAIPQCPKLNRGKWKQLETKVRGLLTDCEGIHLFTGDLYLPINCQDGKKRVIYEVIGNGVAVPTHCFKVLFIKYKHKLEPLAYIFPNAPIEKEKTIESFKTTVEKVQTLSGILFTSWLTQILC